MVAPHGTPVSPDAPPLLDEPVGELSSLSLPPLLLLALPDPPASLPEPFDEVEPPQAAPMASPSETAKPMPTVLFITGTLSIPCQCRRVDEMDLCKSPGRGAKGEELSNQGLRVEHCTRTGAVAVAYFAGISTTLVGP
jgi:hypothetical protein